MSKEDKFGMMAIASMCAAMGSAVMFGEQGFGTVCITIGLYIVYKVSSTPTTRW